MSSDDGIIDLTHEVPPYKRQRLEAGDLRKHAVWEVSTL